MEKPWFTKRNGRDGSGYGPSGAKGVAVLAGFCLIVIGLVDATVMAAVHWRLNPLLCTVAAMAVFLVLLAGLLWLIRLKSGG